MQRIRRQNCRQDLGLLGQRRTERRIIHVAQDHRHLSNLAVHLGEALLVARSQGPRKGGIRGTVRLQKMLGGEFPHEARSTDQDQVVFARGRPGLGPCRRGGGVGGVDRRRRVRGRSGGKSGGEFRGGDVVVGTSMELGVEREMLRVGDKEEGGG